MLSGIEFLFVAIGVSMVVRAVRGGGRQRNRDLPPYPQQPARLEDPRVAQLQTEVEELRTQVERLKDAETFYAQLNAPTPQRPSSEPPPGG